MESDLRPARDDSGDLNFDKLEQLVQKFFGRHPSGTFSITELSEEESDRAEEYFDKRKYAVSPRQVVKSRSDVVCYRLDIRNEEENR